MATKTYTISMPGEIMELIDSVAKRTNRDRSEMLRQMVRHFITCPERERVDVLGALHEAFAPFREATAPMSDEEFDDMIDTAVREVREEKRRAKEA